MTTDIELLRAIVARPDDDTPRLAYADWLDDSATADNGYAARAEYVRLQIRLAREGDRIPPAERASLEKRRWRLHDDHHREWEQGIHKALGYTKMTALYERGFLNELHVSDPERLITSQLLYASTLTVRHLTVEPITDGRASALAAQVNQSQIIGLILRSSREYYYDPEASVLTDAGVEPLTNLRTLRQLDLVGGAITATGAAMIAGRMTGLQHLLIAYNPIGDGGAARIAAMSNLQTLGLGGCGVTAAGATAIATSPTLALSAKLSGLRSAGFRDVATALERSAAGAAAAPQVEWFQTNWKGQPGEILYRTPVAGLSQVQVTELRRQVVDALARDGLSREFAAARVVIRHSAELGQGSLTVVGNAACLALVRAVGRGDLPGVCDTVSRWRDSARGPGHTPDRTPYKR